MTSYLILLLVEGHGNGHLEVVLLLQFLLFAGGGGRGGAAGQLGLLGQGAAEILRGKIAAGVRLLVSSTGRGGEGRGGEGRGGEGRGGEGRGREGRGGEGRGGEGEGFINEGTLSRGVSQHSRLVQVLVADVTDSGLLLDAKVRQGRTLAGALGANTLATVAAVVLQRQREGMP